MPEFISKIQHNTYEKGEFSDEKERTLEETLELIKTFPWDNERTLTDIQLTGPSITIQDEYLNYLKIGLYFGGKYCLYYLDNDSHLYEYHAPTIEDVYVFVTDFFNGRLNLQKFDKHLINIGSRKHFENGNFDYTISKEKIYLRFIFTLLFGLFIAIMGVVFIFIHTPLLAKLILIPFYFLMTTAMAYTLFLMVGYYRKSKDMFLHLSSGNNNFQFGIGDEIKDYNKSDITDITIYGSASSKGTPVFNIIEIKFINNSILEFPVFLIDQFLVQTKFPGIKINIIYKVSELRKRRWKYATSHN